MYFIDVSQSVEHNHPRALDFLRMDCKNVSGACALGCARPAADAAAQTFTSARGFARRAFGTRLTLWQMWRWHRRRRRRRWTGCAVAPAARWHTAGALTPRQLLASGETRGEEDAESEVAEQVFMQAFIPRTLTEVEDYERDAFRVAGGDTDDVSRLVMLACEWGAHLCAMRPQIFYRAVVGLPVRASAFTVPFAVPLNSTPPLQVAGGAEAEELADLLIPSSDDEDATDGEGGVEEGEAAAAVGAGGGHDGGADARAGAPSASASDDDESEEGDDRDDSDDSDDSDSGADEEGNEGQQTQPDPHFSSKHASKDERKVSCAGGERAAHAHSHHCATVSGAQAGGQGAEA